MHKNRMNEIGRWVIPPEGTSQRAILEKRIAANSDNPHIQQLTKKIFDEAVACCSIQAENGSGLPADSLIREYNTEYNSRVFNYSLHDLPSSFNVVEAFNKFITPSATFKIKEEKDYIFSFGDFLDFATSSELSNDLFAAKEAMQEEVIYSFNSIDDPEDFIFSTNDGDEFGVLSVSLIRHDNEVSVMLLGGQSCDLEEETKHLDFTKIKRFRNVKPADSLLAEAVPLIKGRNLWRTIVLVRLDLNSSTIDARYVYQDAGNRYIGITDDLDCFTDSQGNFIDEELEECLKDMEVRIKTYTSLFELCKTSIFLPLFRNEFEDVISIERHQTVYGENRNKPKYRKPNKLADSEYKIAFRNVEKITPENRKQPFYREFSAPDLKMESSGYWKKLDFQSVGTDKNNHPIQGRTWINKTLAWREATPNSTTLQVKTDKPRKDGVNHGYIYVMRSAAHDKNIFKVGLTRRNSEVRSQELSNSTSSPDHFLVVEEWEVSDCILAEKMIHDKLKEYRINPKREYFQVSYKIIFKIVDGVIEYIDG